MQQRHSKRATQTVTNRDRHAAPEGLCLVLFVFVWSLCSKRKRRTPAGLPCFPSLALPSVRKRSHLVILICHSMDGFRNVLSGKIEGVEQHVRLFSYTFLKQAKRQPAVTSTVETNMNRGLSRQISLDALAPVQAVGQEEGAALWSLRS